MVPTDDRAPPIRIRAAQLIAIVEGVFPMFATRIVRALELRFPRGLHGVAADDYEEALRELVWRIGERYGIIAPRDVLRVVELAVRRGWQLDEGSDGAWVRTILGDTRVTTPARRVDRLLAEARRRAQIEARNQAIEGALADRRSTR
jgi:hypothetical protein